MFLPPSHGIKIVSKQIKQGCNSFSILTLNIIMLQSVVTYSWSKLKEVQKS